MVRETELSAEPLRATRCSSSRARTAATPIESMPGVERLSISQAVEEAGEVARAGHPGRAAVRPARRQGRAGLGRLRRRGRRPARGARAQGGAPRAGRDHRRVPVRVHDPRPLRRACATTASVDNDARSSCSPAPPSRTPRGRRRRRAERHDGRPRRRAARAARRRRASQDLPIIAYSRQVRLGLLRAVPRGGRLGARLRRPPRLPDGPRQRRARPCARRCSTSTRAPTSSWSSPRCPTST